jgi:membrane protein insertase Oxa1/YidC/SpoIIIJ
LKVGGAAGLAALISAIKFKGAFFLLFKLFWITRLFHLVLRGGGWAIIGVLGILAIILIPVMRHLENRQYM